MIYVVGSGPAGVACAKALVENGAEVTVLDVGLDLEPERKEQVRTLREAAPEDWRRDGAVGRIVDDMVGEMLAATGADELPTKLRYGSDFPYRGTDDALDVTREGVGGSASFAKGGLSNVWGAQALPFRDEDIDDWPVDGEALGPYYAKAFEMMGLAAERDDLETWFPLHVDDPDHVERSAQARRLMARLREKRETLNGRGIHFGYSRLALAAEGEDACPRCGLKIFGCCPRGSVYDATETLEELRVEEDVRYRSGVLIEEAEEGAGTAVAKGRSYEDGSAVRFEGEKVFLACGAIPTTKILLRSLGRYDEPVRLQETPYFVLPMLRPAGAGDVRTENPNTLAQLYLELMDEELSGNTVHLEIFTYNDLYEAVIGDALGPLYSVAKPALTPILSRIVVAMGYLHSDHSDGIEVRVSRDGELTLRGEVGDETRADVRAVARKLLWNSWALGTVPVIPSLDVKPPGESFHLGGSFPMSERPGRTETDLLGRPRGFERVHAVDSTVFPSVPATTITPTIMAMAYRIGAEHDRALGPDVPDRRRIRPEVRR